MSEPHHLSKLRLDRYLAGELPPEEAAAVESRLDDRARAHLDGIAAAEAEVPRLDLAALRARAAAAPDASPTALYDDMQSEAVSVPSAPAPAPAEPLALDAHRRARWVPAVVTSVLLAAAAVLLVVGLSGRGDTYHVRGKQLTVHVAQGGALHPYDGEPVGAGDVLGFRVVAGEHRGVVLVSVDGTGLVSVFFPADGKAPEPLRGPGTVELPGTVMLDDAPGPELFVAVFDRPTDEAKRLVQQTYWNDGITGLRRLGLQDDISVAEVARR